MRQRDGPNLGISQIVRLANPEIFEKLTEIIYQKPDETKEESKEDDAPQCAVCYQDFEQCDVLKQLPCRHQFHKACLKPWFDKKNTCPLCRVELSA
ncbi:hypothetical protein FGO68_gene9345 [Halteria grandinella]|uniref:RING-type domain-containing protein n=1 Tax=Halteria grandinella TaxID=5974 RepID=A0A8J8T0V3_HALGN|nr:hypothetical protein FGO68_gene9345 [Halteria grandinella]